MNREILFKGFHPCDNGKDRVFINGEWINGEWIEGFYWKDIWGDNTEYIYYDSKDYEVIPETVGQYIGRADKNKKIFVGDIVKSCDNPPQSFIIKCGKNYIGYEYYFANLDGTIYKYFMPYALKIIGNIHSNPELLEAAE